MYVYVYNSENRYELYTYGEIVVDVGSIIHYNGVVNERRVKQFYSQWEVLLSSYFTLT